ncbi:cell cycle regulator of non-homologous end joining-like [Sciurus carolinensis]|uniref:cell cycle regulator of non-homologous end joining-like n=1 Tax=Sciurus carolinensis TaxID=30640 RepID=UPI001FB28804|nr:cell cycle regulator of non-homologous end joining-like [Sciurus carolinensis]
METLKSGSKKRVLPSWMTSQMTERRVVPVKTPKRRRMAAGTPAMKTVYCMNEAEMMDVALGILIEVKSAVSLSALMTRDFKDRKQSKVLGYCQGFCFC